MRPFFLNLIGTAARGAFLYAHPLYFAAYAAYKRRTDRTKLALIRTLLKPGDRVVDVGAHIGFTTRFLAGCVGASGRVLACEPSPENYRFLRRNVRACPNVETASVAVLSTSGTAQLFLHPTLHVDHHTYATGEPRRRVDVPAATLDALVSDWPAVTLIKLDIQGAELSALQGAQRVLSRNRPHIISEIWPWGLRHAGASVGAVADLLGAAGYDILLIDEKAGTIRAFDPTALAENWNDYYDVYCRPRI